MTIPPVARPLGDALMPTWVTDGVYFEAGYGVSVGELDLSAAWIYSTEDLPFQTADDHTVVFSIGHTFDIN